MLQQILTDMYIPPELLEALNEEQKKTLFLKMRQEQVRRWKEREEKEGKEERREKPKSKKGSRKSVSWLLGRDGDVRVYVIGETDELKSAKLILSELKEQRETNLNKVNRPQTTVPLNSSLANRKQQVNSKPEIELLLKKAEEQQVSDSDTSMDDQKDDSDFSDSSSSSSSSSSTGFSSSSNSSSSSGSDHNRDVGVVRLCRTARDTSVIQRLNQINLQRSNNEQLPVKEKPNPQDTATHEKEVENEQGIGFSYGNRVAQLRRTFNTTSTKTKSPCAKPPIPTKPAHLMASASVR